LIRSIVTKFLRLKFILVLLLRLDNLLYKLISISAVEVGKGRHPKHDIIQYEKWFLDKLSNDSIVLDIGSNLGEMAILMSEKCKKSYGIEINPQAVETAQRSSEDLNNVEFFCSDVMDFDFTILEEISVVTMSNVLEHIDNRSELLIKLKEKIKWTASPKFLIRVPLIDREWISVYKKNLGLEWRLDNTHFIEYTLQSFEEELELSGLRVKESLIRFGELFAICESNT